jgi:urea carboxylase
MVLDLGLRLRIHALTTALESDAMPGIIEVTPGIRSFQIQYASDTIDEADVLRWLQRACENLPDFDDISVPTRTVYLPLAWDHSETRVAIRRYMQSVREDAPWCPDNIDFIRRINGLDSREQVRKIVNEARYLVMGLGDVYLGAPVATPIDPRHRLVTTKYNPARTWTPENAVGIGGAYLCVYGMEGPGGYQFVGRTLQMWNRFRETDCFEPGKPWLLRFFDQIRFFPVEEEALRDIRRNFLRGTYALRMEEGEFKASDLTALLARHGEEIESSRSRRQKAFDAERERWAEAGLATDEGSYALAPTADDVFDAPAGSTVCDAHVAGSVWEISFEIGDRVSAGDAVVILEAMKTEIRIEAPIDAEVVAIACKRGDITSPGQPLFALRPI